jgi:hypothetical protein
MSLYDIQKLFYHLNTDPKAKQRFQRDPDGMLADYRLSPDEARAITSVDLATLYRLGVHPLLLRPFATLKGVGMPEYRKALSGLEEEQQA